MEIIWTSKLEPIMVDDCDYEQLSLVKWYLDENGYARNGKLGGMHTHLLPPPPGFEVDHRDCNPQNKQRMSNLRIVTKSQNAINKRMRSDNTSGYKGVTYDPHQGMWEARLNVNNRPHKLGFFKTAEEQHEPTMTPSGNITLAVG